MIRALLTLLCLGAVWGHGTHGKCPFSHQQHAHHEHPPAGTTKTMPWSANEVFWYALGSGVAVSMIGFLAAFLLIGFKLFSTMETFSVVIQVLFALSCGALLGEVLLHLLPQAYESSATTSDNIGIFFIISVCTFTVLERLFEFAGICHSHYHQEDQLSQHKTTSKQSLHRDDEEGDEEHKHEGEEHKHEEHKHKEEEQNDSKQQKDIKQMDKQKYIVPATILPSQVYTKNSLGFLNLLSSLLHNFIDGFAIGVAYSTGNPHQFIPITVGIIAHEIPREMGDVAILMKSHFSAKETILSNGFVNCISIVGVVLGLYTRSLTEGAKQYILVFVAGNFIYIAADIWNNLFRSRKWTNNLLEIVGLVLGVLVTFGHSHQH